MKTEVLSTTVYLELSTGNLEASLAVSVLMIGVAVAVLAVVRIVRPSRYRVSRKRLCKGEHIHGSKSLTRTRAFGRGEWSELIIALVRANGSVILPEFGVRIRFRRAEYQNLIVHQVNHPIIFDPT